MVSDLVYCAIRRGQRIGPAMGATMTPVTGKLGLRERKKATTRAALREHAMRLFLEQGFAVTTVGQIAEAAEVSPSTFFRYFPTKEDVVLDDDFDPILFASFHAQPEGLSPIDAMRATLHDVFASLPDSDWTAEMQRRELMMSVPELRGAIFQRTSGLIGNFAEQVAKRSGRDPGDFEVRNFSGVIVGMALATLDAGPSSRAQIVTMLDRALTHLEAGLPL